MELMIQLAHTNDYVTYEDEKWQLQLVNDWRSPEHISPRFEDGLVFIYRWGPDGYVSTWVEPQHITLYKCSHIPTEIAIGEGSRPGSSLKWE